MSNVHKSSLTTISFWIERDKWLKKYNVICRGKFLEFYSKFDWMWAPPQVLISLLCSLIYLKHLEPCLPYNWYSNYCVKTLNLERSSLTFLKGMAKCILDLQLKLIIQWDLVEHLFCMYSTPLKKNCCKERHWDCPWVKYGKEKKSYLLDSFLLLPYRVNAPLAIIPLQPSLSPLVLLKEGIDRSLT